MTEKRFQWVFIKDNELEFQDNGIVKRFNNDRLEEFLNEFYEENEHLKKEIENNINSFKENNRKRLELEEENERLKKVIVENEKLIQSTYDELTELRCIKKNIKRIKAEWDRIMEAIEDE